MEDLIFYGLLGKGSLSTIAYITYKDHMREQWPFPERVMLSEEEYVARQNRISLVYKSNLEARINSRRI